MPLKRANNIASKYHKQIRRSKVAQAATLVTLARVAGQEGAARERTRAAVAQLVERVLGKDEVMGPTPISSFEKLRNQGIEYFR